MPLVISPILATINIKCNVCDYLDMNDEFVVNGLPLPPLLIELLKQDKWQHPGEKVIREVIPFLLDPVIFIEAENMHRQSTKYLEIMERWSFHAISGAKSTIPVELPWLDIDRAVLIAANKQIGDDVAIALDYRTSVDNPRVVASDWHNNKQHLWREVTPTFSDFVERIGIKLT
jgi:hypothetical protein